MRSAVRCHPLQAAGLMTHNDPQLSVCVREGGRFFSRRAWIPKEQNNADRQHTAGICHKCSTSERKQLKDMRDTGKRWERGQCVCACVCACEYLSPPNWDSERDCARKPKSHMLCRTAENSAKIRGYFLCDVSDRIYDNRTWKWDLFPAKWPRGCVCVFVPLSLSDVSYRIFFKLTDVS